MEISQGKKMDIKLVSLDVFQTLVNVSSIKYKVWKIFLKKSYSAKLAEELWDLATKKLVAYFSNDISKNTEYESVKSIFSKCYSEIFQEFHIDFDHEKAGKILADYHNRAEPFDDTDVFMDFIENNYTYCLSSDTDNDMIKNLKYTKNSHMVFTSENLKGYKNSRDNTFFRSIFHHYDLEAHEILHVGDSVQDILNPKGMGMKTCWINRNNRTWQHKTEPDYICSGLKELMLLL